MVERVYYLPNFIQGPEVAEIVRESVNFCRNLVKEMKCDDIEVTVVVPGKCEVLANNEVVYNVTSPVLVIYDTYPANEINQNMCLQPKVGITKELVQRYINTSYKVDDLSLVRDEMCDGNSRGWALRQHNGIIVCTSGMIPWNARLLTSVIVACVEHQFDQKMMSNKDEAFEMYQIELEEELAPN